MPDYARVPSCGLLYYCPSSDNVIPPWMCYQAPAVQLRGKRAGIKVRERELALKRNITTHVTRRDFHPKFALEYCKDNRTFVNHHNLVNIRPSLKPKQGSFVNVATINCESCNNKTTDLVDYIIDQDLDICCLTETWLQVDDSVTPRDLCPEGYDIISVPRPVRRGGGVAVIYNKTLGVKAKESNSFSSFEYVLTELSHPEHSIPFTLANVYRPPRSNMNNIPMSVFFDEITNFLTTLVIQTGRLVVTGDFNIHVDNPNSTDASRFLDILDSLDLQQHVCDPTHRAGHTLDLVITPKYSDLIVSKPKAHYLFSSHMTVRFSLNFKKTSLAKKSLQCRKLKSIDIKHLKQDVVLSELCERQSETLEDLVSQYHATLSDLLNKHAPVLTVNVPNRKRQPWYNSSIADAKRVRRRMERKWRKSRLESDRLAFIKERNEVSSLISSTKQEYFLSRVQQCHGDQKALFSEMNRLLHKPMYMPLPPHDSPRELADRFMSFFCGKVDKIRLNILNTDSTSHPVPVSDVLVNKVLSSFSEFTPLTSTAVTKLIMSSKSKSCSLDAFPTNILKQCIDVLAPVITNMINLSLTTGTVPTNWKRALITPILKKPGSDITCSNFRPISNLDFCGKICEKSVAAQFLKHVNDNNLGENFQSAYKQGHSTETALLRVFNDILHSIDNQKVTILVLLDLSAAFDTVDHKIILQRLQSRFGISGSALSWFQSYLADRSERVLINNITSNQHTLTCGVPQGSVLGPILFLVYMSPLGDVIRQHNLNFHFYADDSQIFLSFESGVIQQQENAVCTLNNAVSDIRSWMAANMLMLNDDKTELMVIGTHQQLAKINHPLTIKTGDVTIYPSDKARDLGVILDQHLKLQLHINNIIKSAVYHLRNIARIRKYLTVEASVLIVHAFITSRLDYCNSLLYGLPRYQLNRLQYIQNCAARLIYRSKHYTHVTPLLKDLHWLPVEARVQFKICLITYKALNGNAPAYIRELILRDAPGRTGLRSQNLNRLVVPSTRSRAQRSTVDRAFSICAPKLWNTLPEDCKNCKKETVFKSLLKTFLFKKFYT